MQTNIINSSPLLFSSNAGNPELRDMPINIQDFLSFISTKEGLSDNSINNCRKTARLINEWFSDRELSKKNVEDFIFYLKNEKKLKNNTLNAYLFTFRHIVSYCKDRGLPSEFLEGFKNFKKTKSNIIILTIEEIKKLLNTSLPRGKWWGKDCSYLDFINRTLTMFIAYTGCRFSEAADLKIKNLDISAGKATFTETKTNENRTVYFTEPLKNSLKKLIEKRGLDDFVFTNAHGKHIFPQDYINDLKKRAKKAGIIKRTYPHILRHSYITHLLEADVPITEVASLVGHKDIQTTYSTYMHLADQTLRKAAMRHPMVRENIDPNEIIKIVKETIEDLHLEKDKRFIYSINEKDGGLSFELALKTV